MPPKQKIIIDTDPGVDDILALLLAFSATPEELDILLISLTFGNIDVQNCLRNTVSLFHHIEKEIKWRIEQGKKPGFDTLRNSKPIVAVGAEEPLAEHIMMADFFHGVDGLGGIHSSHPHLTPQETWKTLFDSASKTTASDDDIAVAEALEYTPSLFQPSQRRSHDEILRLLKENEADTVSIIAVGPLTNLALAAAQDPETFLRVKEVIVMGNAISEHGNITPVAEFNTYADSFATARVYALTSPKPNSTIPPSPPAPPGVAPSLPHLAPYPEKLSKQLNLIVFPIDITCQHKMTRGQFRQTVEPLVEAGSPLAEWTAAFLTSTFANIESLVKGTSGDAVGIELHDPLCIWYALTPDANWKIKKNEDIRIETSGQWTRGMSVVDRRNRKQRALDDDEGEIPGDSGNWLSPQSGNRISRALESPGPGTIFASYLLGRVFDV